VRATQGLSFQGTYVWSALWRFGQHLYQPADSNLDYNLATITVNDFRANGTYSPVWAQQAAVPQQLGWIARAVEGWQTSFIVNASTGRRPDQRGQYAVCNGVPDVVGPFPVKPFGQVQ